MTDDDLKSLALDFRDQMVGIDLLRAVFQAGAASRDAEIAELRSRLGLAYQGSELESQETITELVAALKPFGAIDLVESRLPAEFAMLILRARAAIAKARKP